MSNQYNSMSVNGPVVWQRSKWFKYRKKQYNRSRKAPLSLLKPSCVILRRRSKPWFRSLIFCLRSLCFSWRLDDFSSPSSGEITFLWISDRERERQNNSDVILHAYYIRNKTNDGENNERHNLVTTVRIQQAVTAVPRFVRSGNLKLTQNCTWLTL